MCNWYESEVTYSIAIGAKAITRATTRPSQWYIRHKNWLMYARYPQPLQLTRELW